MNWDLFVKIAVPVGTWVLGIFGERWKQQAPKLLMYLGHASVFHVRLDEKTEPVNTHAIVILNAGRKAAKNVRIPTRQCDGSTSSCIRR